MNSHLRSQQTSHKTRSLKHNTNRIAYKCKEQRNGFIRREINELIKKQSKVFFARKKIEKELQNHNKEYIVVNLPSALERVKGFRVKEKQNNISQLEKYKNLCNKRQEKVEKVLEKKKEQNYCKTAENFHKMQKVRQNFQNILQKNYQKIQRLKDSFFNETPRIIPRLRHSHSHAALNSNQNRISIASSISKRYQDQTVNNFMHKMKQIEERNIKKEVALQTKKTQALKNIPKCYISKRTQQQEQMMVNWENQNLSKFEKFQKSRQNVLKDRNHQLIERSFKKGQICEQIWDRKLRNQENLANGRIVSMQNKLIKIDKISKNKNKMNNKSQISINRNEQNIVTEHAKQSHNQQMRTIYNIIKKLKSLDNIHQLSRQEVAILQKQKGVIISNLNEKDTDFLQVVEYLNMTKDKFFQKKQKEDEERAKQKNKIKKNHLKVL